MNKHYVRILMVGLIFLFGKNGIAQTSITGKISDKETGEDMISANVVVSKNGIFIAGETTDVDGNYVIQVEAGTYDLEVFQIGYPNHKVTKVIVNDGEETKVDVLITYREVVDIGLVFLSINIPLLPQDKMEKGQKYEGHNVEKQPTRNINEIIMMTPGVTLGQ